MPQTYTIGALDGDGIGREIVTATLSVLDALQKQRGTRTIEWVRLPMGHAALETHKSAMPASVIQELARCHGWIMGPHDSVSYPPEEQKVLTPSAILRKHFNLYANIRPARNLSGAQSLVRGVDLTIVRENSEGFYADRNMHRGSGEFEPVAGVVLATGLVTESATERIAHNAFRLAQTRRGYVSIVHKANVLKMAHGLFRDSCYQIAKQYPDVRVDDYHVDAMAALLVRRPADFDVIVTTNMFGDILSDLATELVGSLGMGGSINAGDEQAMAQAVHGAAPDIAGQGIANPIGMMQSAALLLEWLGKKHQDEELIAMGQALVGGIEGALSSGVCPPDLGGSSGTEAFAKAVIERTPC